VWAEVEAAFGYQRSGGEGKSFTVYNLGLAFAATGLKVLIIDADLRLPAGFPFPPLA